MRKEIYTLIALVLLTGCDKDAAKVSYATKYEMLQAEKACTERGLIPHYVVRPYSSNPTKVYSITCVHR